MKSRLLMVSLGLSLGISLGLLPAARADEDVLKQAQTAYVRGEYARSIELAQKGMELDTLRAWRILGANYCVLKDKAKAQEALAKVDAPGQQYLRYNCKRNGISLD